MALAGHLGKLRRQGMLPMSGSERHLPQKAVPGSLDLLGLNRGYRF
jgi:hypothetical protein